MQTVTVMLDKSSISIKADKEVDLFFAAMALVALGCQKGDKTKLLETVISLLKIVEEDGAGAAIKAIAELRRHYEK